MRLFRVLINSLPFIRLELTPRESAWAYYTDLNFYPDLSLASINKSIVKYENQDQGMRNKEARTQKVKKKKKTPQ